MTKRHLFELAARLAREGVSFVVATVVRRDGLSSAHQGDVAIVTATGELHGWIGGGCTRPTVEREAAKVLAEGKPRLISLSPDPDGDRRAGVLSLPMTCQSGGTVEVYLDPVLAAPRLVLFGRAPIVRALAELARTIGYRVDAVDPELRADEVPAAERRFTALDAPELAGPGASVVVASMNDGDEEAVLAALALAPAYLGVVASRRRFALLRDALLARGADPAALDRIASPAGLDLGAREAGEVAVSILAQIIARRNAVAVVREGDRPVVPPPAPIAAIAAGAAIDPICKMTVTIATARHVGEWDGRAWYFCCAGCKTRFLADPTRYASATAGGSAP